MILSRRARQIEESVTLAITAKAAQLRSAGIPVISLSVGEPDMATPSHICDAAVSAMRSGKTHYTAAAGDLALRQAICDKLFRENGLVYNPSQIVVSNGAKHSLHNVFQSILNPGDEVIVPSPCWVSYPEMVKISDGVPVLVETRQENQFVPTLEDIRAAVTEKTKALVLCNPCNPTGAVIPPQEVRALVELAIEKDFFIVSDEIYEHLIYDGKCVQSPASFSQEAYDHTIIINGVSKAYAMTGWRIGYTASSVQVARLIANLQSQTTSAPNTIAQEASRAALNGPFDTVAQMRDEFDIRRRELCEGLSQVEGLSFEMPHGAFYLFLNIKAFIGKTIDGEVIRDDVDFAAKLLERNHVAVVPGTGFKAPGYIRISYAVKRKEMKRAIRDIADFCHHTE